MQLFATPWTISHQAPLPMEFSRQEYWSELPFPSPGCLPNPGIEPRSPALWADSLPSDIFLGNHFLKCINLIFDMKSESEVAQSCPTLCDPVDCSPPGSSVPGILQARILEWVAIPFSRGSSQSRDWTQISCIAGSLFTIWATIGEATILECSGFSINIL